MKLRMETVDAYRKQTQSGATENAYIVCISTMVKMKACGDDARTRALTHSNGCEKYCNEWIDTYNVIKRPTNRRFKYSEQRVWHIEEDSDDGRKKTNE